MQYSVGQNFLSIVHIVWFCCSLPQIERNYYYKNTKIAEEQRKVVDQNCIQGKTQYQSLVLWH